MKVPRAALRFLGLLSLFVLIGVVSSIGCAASPDRPAAADRMAHGHLGLTLSSMLPGFYEGSSPGNQLTLRIRSLAPGPGLLDHRRERLWVRLKGDYQGANLDEQGYIELQDNGGTVYLGVASSRGSECNFLVIPSDSHFVGETYGTPRGRLGGAAKWRLQVTESWISLENLPLGETLSFQRIPKKNFSPTGDSNSDPLATGPLEWERRRA